MAATSARTTQTSSEHRIIGRIGNGVHNSKRKYAASVPHTDETIKELRSDRKFAVEYLKAMLEELNDPDNRAAGLLALRDIAEAYGGIAAVAQEAGIAREALYRALPPRATPR